MNFRLIENLRLRANLDANREFCRRCCRPDAEHVTFCDGFCRPGGVTADVTGAGNANLMTLHNPVCIHICIHHKKLCWYFWRYFPMKQAVSHR
jgi:hypothetical protein